MRETFPEPLLVGVDDQLAHSARVLQFELGLRGKYQCWVSRLWRPSPAEKKDNGMGLKLNCKAKIVRRLTASKNCLKKFFPQFRKKH